MRRAYAQAHSGPGDVAEARQASTQTRQGSLPFTHDGVAISRCAQESIPYINQTWSVPSLVDLSIGKFLHRHAPHLEAARNFGKTDALQVQLPNRFIALHALAAGLFPLPVSLRTRNGRCNTGSVGYHDLLKGLPIPMKDAF